MSTLCNGFKLGTESTGGFDNIVFSNSVIHDTLINGIALEMVDGGSLGRVADWNESGGPGLLVLEDGLMIPFAHSICVEIDPTQKRIVVQLPEGLKDLNRP